MKKDYLMFSVINKVFRRSICNDIYFNTEVHYFEDYLFTNAYLERASTSRHEYAVIESKNYNTQIFKLNLQVRLRSVVYIEYVGCGIVKNLTIPHPCRIFASGI